MNRAFCVLIVSVKHAHASVGMASIILRLTLTQRLCGGV
jgi:hypothetical protein